MPPPPAALLIRAAGDLLNLPHRSICTALVFCHRWHAAAERGGGLDEERLASTCLFLASKVEEASLRTNDLLNAVRHLHCRRLGPWGVAGGAVPAEQERGVEAGEGEAVVLVGDAYYAAKAQLIGNEQVLLRALRFDIGVAQPHKYLYALARTLRAPDTVVRLATCLLNDGMVYLGGLLERKPEAAAAGALQVALAIAQEPMSLAGEGTELRDLWGTLGLDAQEVALAAQNLHAMLATAQH